MLVEDPRPEARGNAWRSYRACLAALPRDATHLLVVQDDCLVCGHFLEAATRALTAEPARVVSFFVAGAPVRARRRVEAAASVCSHWAELDPADWCPTVALALPTADAADLAAWSDAQPRMSGRTSDDAVVGDWIRETGRTVLATVPSLVQHPDDVRSLIGTAHASGRNPARVAACYIGDHDARTIIW